MDPFEEPDFESMLPVAIGGDREVLLRLLLEIQNELATFVEFRIGKSLQGHLSQDDVLQETFIRAFRGASSIQATDRAGLVSWLKSISANLIRDEFKSQDRVKRGGKRTKVELGGQNFEDRALDLAFELVEAEPGTPSHFAARREAVDAMQVALANLPDDQRQAVRLHFFERLTMQETANKMDRTWDSVRGLIQRAKNNLRETMHKSSLWLSRKT